MKILAQRSRRPTRAVQHRATAYRARVANTPTVRALLRAPSAAQRLCADCNDAVHDDTRAAGARRAGAAELQRSASTPARAHGDASATVASGTSAGGAPLPAGLRHFFEPRFGHDLSSVRLHTGARAGESAHALDARAYTVGRDIVFAPGAYNPDTNTGRRLIAHELAHVVQQAGGAGAISAAPRFAVQRYGHRKNCKDDFLKSHVWPGVDLAKKMMPHVLNSLCAAEFGNNTKRNRHARGQMESVFGKDWKGKLPQIYETLWRLRAVVSGANFIFNCVHDCDSEDKGDKETQYAYSRIGAGEDGTINLCVENLEPNDLQHFALVLLHELGHIALNLDHGKDENSWDCGGDLSDAQCFGLLAQRMWQYVDPVYSTSIGDVCLGGGSAATRDPANWD